MPAFGDQNVVNYHNTKAPLVGVLVAWGWIGKQVWWQAGLVGRQAGLDAEGAGLLEQDAGVHRFTGRCSCRCSREVDSAMPCTAPQGRSGAAGCAGSPAREGAGADVDGATVLGSTALTGNCLPFGSPGAVGNTHRTAVVARAPHLSSAVPPELSRWQKGGW